VCVCRCRLSQPTWCRGSMPGVSRPTPTVDDTSILPGIIIGDRIHYPGDGQGMIIGDHIHSLGR